MPDTGAVIDRYPPVEPYATGSLDVAGGNVLYWESVGNPGGLPAVYLHGGPGGGSWPGARRYFDPAAYRAVLFDQRGCGRSVPLADSPDVDLDTNTTRHLVSDIEALREHLGVDRWVLGVSWGVTLGLVYAQAHPERVIAMVLGAVTSGRRRETEWITRGVGRIFPREWEAFAAGVPEAERGGDLAAAYARLLASPDPAVRDAAARAWCAWEDAHVSHARVGAQPRVRRSDVPQRLCPSGDPLLEPRLLPGRWPGARRDAAPGRDPRDAHPRPVRRLRPGRRSLAAAPGLAG